jgi:hypothetical protein
MFLDGFDLLDRIGFVYIVMVLYLLPSFSFLHVLYMLGVVFRVLSAIIFIIV